MRFAYALHMRRHNLVLLSCLYTEPFELDIEIVPMDQVLTEEVASQQQTPAMTEGPL